MASPKVSVILPVYNAEKYLCQCLDSIIGQSFADIEIICVDDGSTDSSRDILRQYEAREPRLLAVYQQNQGAGAARNNGIEHARGEYLCFMDADDYMAPDAVMTLHTCAVQLDADVVKCDYCCVDTVSGEIVEDGFPALAYLTKDDFGRVIHFHKEPEKLQCTAVVPWNGMYRKELLEKYGIRFNHLRCVNDRSFYFDVLIHAERAVISDARLVYHRVNNVQSLVGQRIKHFECHFESYRIIEKLCRELPENLKKIILDRQIADMIRWCEQFKHDAMYGTSVVRQMRDFLAEICEQTNDEENVLGVDGPIIVYGLGQIGKIIIPYLKEKTDCDLIGGCSSNTTDDGVWRYGTGEITIRSIESWKKHAPDAVVLIATQEVYHREIAERCRTASFGKVLPLSQSVTNRAYMLMLEEALAAFR